jgi:hypothetical protein
MSSDLKNVFTGSAIEAGFIVEILEENGIGVISRNPFRESVSAGWVSAIAEDSARLFVETENEEKALKLIEEYLSNR